MSSRGDSEPLTRDTPKTQRRHGGGVEEEKQEGMGVACSVQVNRNSKDGFLCLQERFLEQSPSFA